MGWLHDDNLPSAEVVAALMGSLSPANAGKTDLPTHRLRGGG